jgi:hypothetical protein
MMIDDASLLDFGVLYFRQTQKGALNMILAKISFFYLSFA